MSKLPRDGSAWIAGLLLASLGAVAVVAWQAMDAALTHRAAAEAVLRDYARLAADELVRRTLSEVGYYGCYRLLNVLGQRGPDAALPSRGSLAADERTARALTLARYVFALDPATGRLETAAGPPPAAAVERWLRDALRPPRASPDAPPMAAARALIGGELHRFVYAADERGRLVGFEVEPEGLREWFAAAVGDASLLPPSLAKGGGDDGLLVATVTDADGREVFRAGHQNSPAGGPAAGEGDPYAPLLAAEAPYGDGYEGIFEGMTARVTLRPSAASRLVIGGLPRSRLPALLGLMTLTFALLGAAIVLLRRARALARLRSDFVSQVSHELRTPLTQIRMFAETLLLGRVRSHDEGRRSLEIIDREARRLSHLVENVLQFSRGERGAVRLAAAPRRLAPLAGDVARDFSALADRDVTFVLQPCDDVRAAVDDDALRQVLLNLLDNAVKYGPPGQQVRIGLERAGGRARLWVDDEGPGVPAAERDRIWRSFERLERDRRSAVAGTGIGLAVVRELVALHGGRAWVEAGERGGARFVVELPLAERETVTGRVEEVPA